MRVPPDAQFQIRETPQLGPGVFDLSAPRPELPEVVMLKQILIELQGLRHDLDRWQQARWTVRVERWCRRVVARVRERLSHVAAWR
jgi:hypothetical protein